MEFLHPTAWWGLLSLPAILALHFFRRRYQTLPSATVMFWKRRQERDAYGRAPRPIRHNPSLWLQLLAAFLITILLAGPQTLKATGEKELILILDSSFSLQARSGNANLAVADRIRNDILQRLDALPSAPVTVIEHGATPRLLTGRRVSANDARRVISQWQPNQPRADWAGTLALLQLWDLARCRLLVFTDHLTEVWKPFTDTELIAPGSPAPNLAITEATRVRLPDQQQERIRLTVHNFSAEPANTELLLRSLIAPGQTNLAHRWSVQLPPDAAATFAVNLTGSPLPYIAELPPDPLDHDNRATLAPIVQPPLEVLLDFQEPARAVPWQHAIQSVTAYVNTPPPATNETVTANLIVSDNLRWLHDPNLTGCVIVTPSATTEPRLYRAPFLVEPNHPLLRGADWDGTILAIGDWPGLAFTPQIPRVSARDTVVLGEIPSRHARKFILHADLARGNLPRQPLFPILVQNAVDIARFHQPGLLTVNIRSGERIEYRPLKPNAEICLRQAAWSHCATAGMIRLPPDRSGLIEITSDGISPAWLSVNHLDAHTSDLRHLSGGTYRTRFTAATVTRALHQEWTIGLTLLLLGIVFSEWICSRKRNP